MTYFAGTMGLSRLGIADGVPRIECNGCGLVYRIKTPPPAWFLDGKAAPGWKLRRDGEKRLDYCSSCKGKPNA